MDDIFKRVWDNLIGRLTGPMNFRLIIQPLVAAGFAIWSGIKDARAGRPAFLWAVVTDPDQRSALLRGAWKDVGKVFILAVVLDAIYQLIQLRAVHLLELLIVAPTLAFIPYVLLRGPVTRVVRMLKRRRSA
jgi:hypothetical protein